MNNLEYVRMLQEAAIAHTRQNGWTPEELRKHGWTWVVRSHFIEYHQPCQPGQAIALYTWVANFQRIRSLRKYRFVRVVDGAILAAARSEWVFMDFRKARPMAIPPEILSAYAVVPEEEEENNIQYSISNLQPTK